MYDRDRQGKEIMRPAATTTKAENIGTSRGESRDGEPLLQKGDPGEWRGNREPPSSSAPSSHGPLVMTEEDVDQEVQGMTEKALAKNVVGFSHISLDL